MSERMEYQTGLWATIVRELKQLVSRPIYVLCMVGAPLFSCIFLLSLMHEGLPHKIPVAIVDHDHTSTSRNFIQQLGSQESVVNPKFLFIRMMPITFLRRCYIKVSKPCRC